VRAPWDDIATVVRGGGASGALRLSLALSLPAHALSLLLGVPLA
jgi:ABC-type sulfate transport system permease component